MLSAASYRLFSAIRQLLLLMVVVGLLAPQAVNAFGSQSDRAVISHADCAGMADHGPQTSDKSVRQMDHSDRDVGATCSDMTCFCMMPFTVSQSSDLKVATLQPASLGINNISASGVSPATLRKPPKNV